MHACGLNLANRALCNGLFPGQLPRGIGLDVSGIVDAVSEGVTDVGLVAAAGSCVGLPG